MIDLAGGVNTLRSFTKDVPAYSPANEVTGAAGAASYATTPGVAQDASVAPPPAAPAPVPVVTGSGSGATFGGVSGCNAAVCEEAIRNAEQARRNARAVDAMLIVDALRAAQPVAPSASPGGGIDRVSGTEAVLALMRAAGVKQDAVGAEVVAVLMVDNGELRRLVQGDRFSKMTPKERYAAIERWLENEELEERLGESTGPGRISLPDVVRLMNEAERVVWAEKVAREQLLGLDK